MTTPDIKPFLRKSISVKSILEREDPPTTSKMYWSRIPGKLVDKYTGIEKAVLSNKDPLEWNQTLYEVLVDQASSIHRKSLKGPAQIIVANDIGFKLIESMVGYRQLMFGEPNAEVGVVFNDAIQMGALAGKFAVYKSANIEANTVLVALAGNGFEYVPEAGAAFPVINLFASTDPNKQMGQIAYWNFVEILDVNVPQG